MSPGDFQRFHADLVAAIEAGVPIRFENSSSSTGGSTRQLLADLNRWQTAVQSQLGDLASVGFIESDWRTDGNISHRYLAALRTFAATDSLIPVLDGLTVQSLAHRQLYRALRWPAFYLGLVIFMALAGLIFFSQKIVPGYQVLQADLLLPAAIQSTERFDFLAWLPMLIYFLIVVLALFIIAMLFGGFHQFIMAWGGRRFVQSRVTATTVHVIPLLLTAGVSLPRAVAIACDLTGADPRTRQKMDSITCTGATAGFWNGLFGYWLSASNHQLNHLVTSVPITMITTFGGTVGLLYGLAIYGPLVQLIKDLTTAGM